MVSWSLEVYIHTYIHTYIFIYIYIYIYTHIHPLFEQSTLLTILFTKVQFLKKKNTGILSLNEPMDTYVTWELLIASNSSDNPSWTPKTVYIYFYANSLKKDMNPSPPSSIYGRAINLGKWKTLNWKSEQCSEESEVHWCNILLPSAHPKNMADTTYREWTEILTISYKERSHT